MSIAPFKANLWHVDNVNQIYVPVGADIVIMIDVMSVMSCTVAVIDQ